jgi:flagellar biosynthesis protein FlhB
LSGNEDKENKTEEPTEKRRTETLERDGGPSSREVGSAAVLIIISAFLAAGTSGLFTSVAQNLAVFIENPANWRLDNGEDAVRLFQVVAVIVSNFLGIFIAAILIAAIAASFIQNPPRLMTSRLMPDFSRVSPSAGLGRLLSSQSLIEFLKGVVKIGATAIAAYTAIGGIATGLIAIQSPPDAVPELIRHLCLRAVFICALLTCVIAAVDVFLTRRKWHSNLMMTKQEIKEEMKQTEGDQALKARLRMIARARIRRRMMANVPKATLVVTNPTHYAVALRYVRNEDSAPKVMAKGQDQLALTIRQIAKRHNIPIIENKLLARSLFEETEVDQLIPPEFYKAVAELIIYLDSKSRQRGNKPGPGRKTNLPPD